MQKKIKDDLISRQAAIDAVERNACNTQRIYDAIKDIPSAQPDLDEWCTDCKEYDVEKHHCPRLNRVIREALKDAKPELCEYYALCRHGRDESKLRARLKFCEYCNEDSDGYVKPIEKNNHAFVRFGMNGWELNLKANGWHGSAKIRYCPMCGRDLYVKYGSYRAHSVKEPARIDGR